MVKRINIILTRMKEQGIVIEILGDTARIRLTQKPDCIKCGICSGASGGFRILTVKIKKPLQVNQAVTVEINQKILTLSSILMYAVPLSGFIIGAIAGYAIGGELLAVILAVVLLIIDLKVVKIIIKRLHLSKKLALII